MGKTGARIQTMQILPTFLSIFLFLLPITEARAAQDAIVIVDQAAVRERPEFDAAVIESIEQGESVKVSSKNKDGWYKTRAKTGQYGWIWQADLSYPEFMHESEAANSKTRQQPHIDRGVRPYPLFSLRLGGHALGLAPTSLSRKLGLGSYHVYFAGEGFIEAGYRTSDRLRLVARFMGYSHESGILYQGVRYDVNMSGYPLLFGGDLDITHGERVDVSAAVYAGVSLSNRLEVVAPAFQPPNSFALEAVAPAVMLNFTSKYFITRFLSGVFETGLYYSYIPKQRVPGPFNADGPFRDDVNTMTELRVSQLALFFGLGIQLDF